MSPPLDAPDTSTPARQRLVTRVLAWGEERPQVPRGLADELRRRLADGFAKHGATRTEAVGDGLARPVVVTRSLVRRLSCDGWQLEPEPYVHTYANVRGVLVREAILTDVVQGREATVPQRVDGVWRAEASRRPGDPASRSAWLNACTPGQARAIRDEVAAAVDVFREVWPPLPSERVRHHVDERVTVRPGDGGVTLRGAPAWRMSSTVVDERARELLVDVRAGLPQAGHDRDDVRFDALLTTLARGRPPFRWVTYYATEGRTETEDFDAGVLHRTADRVVDTVGQLTRLADEVPGAPEERLRLRGGPWCRFCRRRTGCTRAEPAAPGADGWLPPPG